jgi:DNA-binding sugar fermentation-stimulating protein
VFSRTLSDARARGVQLLGRRCRVTLGGVELGEAVPVETV